MFEIFFLISKALNLLLSLYTIYDMKERKGKLYRHCHLIFRLTGKLCIQNKEIVTIQAMTRLHMATTKLCMIDL